MPNIKIANNIENHNITLSNLNNLNEFHLLQNKKYLERVKFFENFIKNIKNNYQKFAILGIGGSINHINATVNCLKLQQKNILIINKINTNMLNQTIDFIDEKTYLFIITKNGMSQDVNTFAKIILKKINNSKNISIISTKNGFNHFNIDKKEYQWIDYEEVSGRFSTFSNAFLVPMMLFDKFNIIEYFQGCNDSIKSNEMQQLSNTLIAEYNNHKYTSILISHSENIDINFFLWYEQITMESTGKINGGIDTIFSEGIEDLHNKFQMFIEGRQNKIFTIIKETKTKNNELSDMINNKQLLSIKALEKNKCPIRFIEIDTLNSYNIGWIFTTLSCEVIHLCKHMGVNPFDQNGVEKMKENQ